MLASHDASHDAHVEFASPSVNDTPARVAPAPPARDLHTPASTVTDATAILPPANEVASSAPVAAHSAPAALSREAACELLYEEVHEPLEVAPAWVAALPVLLLDSDQGEGSKALLESLQLSGHYHLVDATTAAAAAATHGALAVIGGGGGDGGVDELVWSLLRLLVDVDNSAVACDLFAFLSPEPRYGACRAVLRTARKELLNLRIRDLTLRSGPALLPALAVDCRIDGGRYK